MRTNYYLMLLLGGSECKRPTGRSRIILKRISREQDGRVRTHRDRRLVLVNERFGPQNGVEEFSQAERLSAPKEGL